jgi:probable F420-dependent oxidoreductase
MLIDHSLIGHTSTRAAADAGWAERVGFDGVWATESVTDAFLQSMAVALSTEQIGVGTAIAVAFSRNPMSTAYAAWDLAAASEGRFALGLGSQVEAHIRRRFAMPWSPPVDRMRDYIGALRAIFESWRNGSRLRYEGAIYEHTLMSPVFTPPHHDHTIPIGVAAVGPKMTELAGESCDFVILHGMIHPQYFDEVTLPALRRGLDTAGRDPSAVTVSCPLFMVMGDDEATIAETTEATKGQIAFYASTRIPPSARADRVRQPAARAPAALARRPVAGDERADRRCPAGPPRLHRAS